MLLSDALDVRAGDVVALVGGGGKTHALYLLGRELAAQGRPVVLSGTTRFTPPEWRAAPNLLFVSESDPPDALKLPGAWPVTVATGWGRKQRLMPVSPEWVCGIHRLYPELLIVLEADGSGMRPLKAPAAHEPVIPACASLVVSLAGLDVVGAPLNDGRVHRHEHVARLLGRPAGSPIRPEDVSRLLVHPEGGRKGVPPAARWIPLLNKADTPERSEAALQIARHLHDAGAGRVLVTTLMCEPPIVTVVKSNSARATG